MADYFEGVSDNGSLEEALFNAISQAKGELTTDLVTWKLIDISGENGGFVLLNRLKVRIQASPPSGKD
jgi:hypothetical protein